ncbi:MAG: nuclear transport factor 2 family protein [Hyphomonadaceae bacterium]|nr:nuclear transport factor 2 family protein [Hyphomonadaceae bacterium]
MSVSQTTLTAGAGHFGMVFLIAIASVSATPAVAQRPADWVVPTTTPSAATPPAAASAAAAAPVTPGPASSNPAATAAAPSTGQPDDAFTDTSEQVLLADRALADAIFDAGPLAAYSAAISGSGVIFDGNGGAPEGVAGVNQRFSSFPDGVKLDRRPVAAVASGSAGSSWGTYAVRRGDQIMTEGHYLTSWRREASGWRIVTELAAGRSIAPQAAGALPRAPDGPRPASARRSVPAGAPAPAAATALPDVPMRDALGRPVAPAATPPATTRPAATPARPPSRP